MPPGPKQQDAGSVRLRNHRHGNSGSAKDKDHTDTHNVARHAQPWGTESAMKFALSLLTVVVLIAALWEEWNPGTPKAPADVARIAAAGRVAAEALASLEEQLRPGVTTLELDRHLVEFLGEHGATAEPLHYGGLTGGLLRPATSVYGRAICGCFDRAVGLIREWVVEGFPPMPLCGFPGHMCISVNEEVCHGVPSAHVVLKAGDLVKMDVAVRRGGVVGDTCATFAVGGDAAARPEGRQLMETAREALFLGILAVGAGRSLGDVGHAVEAHAKTQGFGVVTTFSGHGVGERFHEAPRVHHVGTAGSGTKLAVGQVFTVEPMLNLGSGLVRVKNDGWTVVSRDSSLSAQWEHTVAVTSDGAEILTLRRGEELPARLANNTDRWRLLETSYPGEREFIAMLDASAERLLGTKS